WNSASRSWCRWRAGQRCRRRSRRACSPWAARSSARTSCAASARSGRWVSPTARATSCSECSRDDRAFVPPPCQGGKRAAFASGGLDFSKPETPRCAFGSRPPCQGAKAMKIAAVGAGRMGRGIALAFAYAGPEVALVDLKVRDHWAQLRTDAMAEMQASLAMLAELGAMPADAVERVMGRITPHAQTQAGVLAEAEVIFEAVPETLEAKRDAFARICELAAPQAVLASTTSTILVTDL